MAIGGSVVLSISNYETLDIRVAMDVVTVITEHFRAHKAHPTVDDVLSKCRKHTTCRPRDIICWILKTQYGYSHDDIGEFFGRTEYQISNNVGKIDEAMKLRRMKKRTTPSVYDERAASRLTAKINALIEDLDVPQ